MYYNSILSKLKNATEITSIALGGSRSRGDFSANSDIDLFCVITVDNFDKYKSNFKNYLESFEEIQCAAELFYLENWGYVFKAIDKSARLYDISIIPSTRIDEMSVRSTNLVLKDTSDLYKTYIENANDELYYIDVLEQKRYTDYVTLFSFEFERFKFATSNNDYWYTIRCLERMKNYYIRCDRIQRNLYPKSRNCPERLYVDERDTLCNIYKLDGTLNTALKTGEKLFLAFSEMIENKDLFRKCEILWRKN